MAIEYFSHSDDNWDVYLRFKEVINDGEYVLVYFSAPWCTPCKKVKTVVEQCVQKFPNFIFIEVDYDSCNDIVRFSEVYGLPAIKIYHNGGLMIFHEGAITLPKLEACMQKVISSFPGIS